MLSTLKGHFNYLKSFQKFGFSFEEDKYLSILDKLSK